MNILEIIENKKCKKELTQMEVDYFVKQVVSGTEVKDYQISSLLMAMRLNGLSINEAYYLTNAFVETSQKFIFEKQSKQDIFIDKHSSGGVGDKVSLIITPILASLNVGVPKISGRGLGHTGGTIDKLESINVNTNLSLKQANKIFAKTKCVILGQTENLVPADRKLYALRDVTGTVDSQGLMASSILSKKFVINSDYIFIDLKVGSGAILQTLKEAESLANLLIGIAKKMKRKITVTITTMEKSLGRNIGNFLEVQETVDFLTGKATAKDLNELIYAFLIEILVMIKRAKNESEAKKMIDESIRSGAAFKHFQKWISAQDGSYSSNTFKPKHKVAIVASKKGYVEYKSAHELGMIALLIGAGRKTKEEKIDMLAGIVLNKQDNELVNKNEQIAILYSSKPISAEMIKRFEENYNINSRPAKPVPMIIKTISV